MKPCEQEHVSSAQFLNLNHTLTLNLFGGASKIKIKIKIEIKITIKREQA